MTAKNTKYLGGKCSTNAILDYYSELRSVNIRTDLQLMRPDHICTAGIPPEDGKPVHQTNTLLEKLCFVWSRTTQRCFLNCYQSLTPALTFGVTASVVMLLPSRRKSLQWLGPCSADPTPYDFLSHHGRVTKHPALPRMQGF